MQHETDAITVIFYALTGVFGIAICTMVFHAYNRIMKTQDAFMDALQKIHIHQEKQDNSIENNKQHIVRLERVQETQAEKISDQIVSKLRAAGGL